MKFPNTTFQMKAEQFRQANNVGGIATTASDILAAYNVFVFFSCPQSTTFAHCALSWFSAHRLQERRRQRPKKLSIFSDERLSPEWMKRKKVGPISVNNHGLGVNADFWFYFETSSCSGTTSTKTSSACRVSLPRGILECCSCHEACCRLLTLDSRVIVFLTAYACNHKRFPVCPHQPSRENE